MKTHIDTLLRLFLITLLFGLGVIPCTVMGDPPNPNYEPNDSEERYDNDSEPCGKEEQNECPNDNDNPETCTNSAFVRIPLRRASVGSHARGASLVLTETRLTPLSFTPFALNFVLDSAPMLRHYWQTTNTGAPRNVYVYSPRGSVTTFRFENGESIAHPAGRNDVLRQRLLMLDAQGEPTTQPPVWYELHPPNGVRYRYNASLTAGTFGELVNIFHPDGRIVNPATAGFEVIRGDEGELRQIRTPTQLADITVESPHAFRVSLYDLEDIEELTVDGLYVLKAEALPIEEHLIENPVPGSFTRLRYTHYRDDLTDIADFTHNVASNQWEMEKSTGAAPSPTLQTVRYITDANLDGVIKRRAFTAEPGAPETQVVETHTQLLDGERVRTLRVRDPEGLALITIYTHHNTPNEPGRHRKIKTVTQPDGSWVGRNYDTQSRILYELRPWLDTPATAPDNLAANLDNGDATLYEYTPHHPEDLLNLPETDLRRYNDQRPRTVTRKILGQVVSQTYHVYGIDPDGAAYEITEQAATPASAFDDPENLRTTRRYYGPAAGEFLSGRLHSVENSDGTLTTYDYELGEWDDIAQDFTPHPLSIIPYPLSSHLRTTATRGTVDSPDGIANQTTRTRQLINPAGRTVRTETEVYTGTGHGLIAWETREFDPFGQPIRIENHRGEITEMVKRASCCGADEVTGPDGITRKTTHDPFHRPIARTQTVPDGPDLITEYELDSAGNILVETRRDENNTHSLVTFHSYDTAGRRISTTAPTGAATHIEHDDLNRTTTQTNPDGSLIITTRYLDGRTQSASGTGTVSQIYEYGVNPDGSQWTRVTTGDTWQQTTVNMLGQTVEQRQPGFDNVELVTTMQYNNKGQLVKAIPPAGAPTLYAYDELGRQTMTVLDVENSGLAFFEDIKEEPDPDTGDHPLKGSNRVSLSDESYESDGSDWWRESRTHTYDHGTDQPTLVSTTRQRLTGLGTPHPDDASLGLLVAESVSIDIHGNESISRRYINRDIQTVWTEQHSPFSDTPATSLTVGGLTLEQTDTAGITTAFDYDALQRRLGTTDARTGRSFVTYEPGTGLVIKQTDAAGNETLFAHDTTGRQISVTDPEGNTTHSAYTLRGEVAAQWGATYPVVYEYDSQGRMVKLHTLRDKDDNILFSPNVNAKGILTSNLSTLTSEMDATTWVYDEATGLLLEKLYPDGKGPAYTYTPDGRLETRTWARTSAVPAEEPLVTTFGYHPDTLELLTTTYSDGTPAVTNEYDRLGRLVKTTDAFGEKTYAYDEDTFQPKTETWGGLLQTTLTRDYDPQGRPTGFTLGNAYTVTHTYTDQGRFNAVSYLNDVNQVQHTATYAYTANSHMISGYTLGDLTRNVTLENNRNLIDNVANTWDTTLISQFDYTNDDAGKRTGRADSGSAFASTQQNTFGYNARNEVTSVTMRNGNSIYNFDQIGNRVLADVPAALLSPGGTFDYTTNALNQYTSIGASAPPPPISPTHDLDGNLTDDGEGLTLDWNAENRMVRVEKGDMVMLNTFDGQGRRVRKQVFDDGTPIEDHRYFYDSWNLIYEIDVLTATEPTYYVWGLDLSQSLQGAGGVGGLLMVLTPNSELPATAHAVSYDANGNISEYINLANGNVDAHLEYDAFGRIIASTGTAPSNFGFSTKYEDVETGYLYYGFRYYDPETGRWPNRDPIGERGGVNLYGFVGNDGVNGIDLFGLDIWTEDISASDNILAFSPFTATSTLTYDDEALTITASEIVLTGTISVVPNTAEAKINLAAVTSITKTCDDGSTVNGKRYRFRIRLYRVSGGTIGGTGGMLRHLLSTHIYNMNVYEKCCGE